MALVIGFTLKSLFLMMLYKSTLFIKCEKDLFKAIHRHYVSNWRVLYFCIDQCNLYLGNCTMPMRIYIPIKDWISLLLEFIEIPVLSVLYKLVFSTITFSISSFRNKLKYCVGVISASEESQKYTWKLSRNKGTFCFLHLRVWFINASQTALFLLLLATVGLSPKLIRGKSSSLDALSFDLGESAYSFFNCL